jgi:hypothetical protein
LEIEVALLILPVRAAVGPGGLFDEGMNMDMSFAELLFTTTQNAYDAIA